jgi:four helix bundle protein
MQDYRKLQVWEKSHALVLQIYRLTSAFPDDEKYGLTGQIRRSASSIPANLAEGSARGSDADFARFVSIAMGSAAELDYHLLLAHDLGLLESANYEEYGQELSNIRKMLNSLHQKLRANSR